MDDLVSSCWALAILQRLRLPTENVSSILDDDDQTTKEDLDWLVAFEIELARGE